MIKNNIDKIKNYGFYRWTRLLKSTILKKLYYVPVKGSFSQYGEDVIISGLLGNKKSGFYVDIGAFDPDVISNTKAFYQKGWRGINVEPNPLQYRKFLDKRPEDINLNLGISERKGKLTAYKFIETASYTFSEDTAKENMERGLRVENETKIEVDTLAGILNNHARGRHIDFMSVDTEGLDIAVLMSNDWSKYRPTIICVESYNPGDSGYEKKQEKYLSGVGYKKIYDNGLNGFYTDISL